MSDRKGQRVVIFRSPLGWFLVGLCLVLVGCTDRDTALPKATTYPVQGMVVLRDGKPLTKGQVVFVAVDPPALSAVGEIGADGTFTLTTLKPDDGAVPGTYRVKIEPALGIVVGRKGKARAKFDAKYVDEDSSGLLVTIKPEPNHLQPFRLR
jgi:hypothetical protein